MKPIGVILAGGKSSRFSPFVTNKTMWPFLGKPTLQYTIEALHNAGISDLIIVANKENEHFLKSYQTQSPNLIYRLQNEALGMDDALTSITDLISKKPILVLNAVDFFEVNVIKRLVQRVETNDPHLLVCGLKSDLYIPATGYYSFDGKNVNGVVEKPPAGTQPSSVVRLVMDYFQNPDEFLALFSQFTNNDEKDARYELAQNVLLKKYGADIEYTSYWSKLKYPHFVLDVMEILQKYHIEKAVHSTAHISPHAIIEGDVHIDADARVEAGAIIKGPTYIGKRVIIGNHVLIRQSIVEENATIGYGCEVARSYVGPDCQLHHCFVGDSVLEKAVNMSWGTVTANLRLDHQNVQCKLINGTKIPTNRLKLGAMIAQGAFLGVNVSTMPGICIQANTTILPQDVVR